MCGALGPTITQVAANVDAISVNTSSIVQNSTSISANTGQIDANSAKIELNTAAIGGVVIDVEDLTLTVEGIQQSRVSSSMTSSFSSSVSLVYVIDGDVVSFQLAGSFVPATFSGGQQQLQPVSFVSNTMPVPSSICFVNVGVVQNSSGTFYQTYGKINNTSPFTLTLTPYVASGFSFWATTYLLVRELNSYLIN